MSLSTFEDKYMISWVEHKFQAYQAVEWCVETFGPEWGTFFWTGLMRDGVTTNYFTFHKIEHAEWFMLKWKH